MLEQAIRSDPVFGGSREDFDGKMGIQVYPIPGSVVS